jgi:hypothetical protein
MLDMQCSMTMSVLSSRVRCHHPRDQFTRVKTIQVCRRSRF